MESKLKLTGQVKEDIEMSNCFANFKQKHRHYSLSSRDSIYLFGINSISGIWEMPPLYYEKLICDDIEL